MTGKHNRSTISGTVLGQITILHMENMSLFEKTNSIFSLKNLRLTCMYTLGILKICNAGKGSYIIAINVVN